MALAAGALGGEWAAPLLEPLEKPLVFRPRPLQSDPLAAAARPQKIEEVEIAAEDGVRLHGWLKRPAAWQPGERHPLVIIYGGVGQELSELVGRSEAGGRWGWLAVNYRGFGRSEGSPSERVVLGDAKRVYDWAAAHPDVERENIVVLGRSLGSYVAIAVAAARRVRAAILATPFDSAAKLGEERFPGLPLGWLVQGRYDPSLMAPLVSVPALFLLAEHDDITPVKHGLALARLWGGIAKTVLLAGAGHSGIEEREEFWRSIGEYLATLERFAGAPSATYAAGSSTGR